MGLAEKQAVEVHPPRKGLIKALTVDSTARSYDITALPLAGVTPDNAATARNEVWLTLQAETADVFFSLSSASYTSLDDTAAAAADGAAMSGYTDTHAARLVADDTISFRIDRSRDKFLNVKAASTSGILRFWASSGPGA